MTELWSSIRRSLPPTIEQEVDGLLYGALSKSVRAIYRDRRQCEGCTMLVQEQDCGRPVTSCRVIDGDAGFDMCPVLVGRLETFIDVLRY